MDGSKVEYSVGFFVVVVVFFPLAVCFSWLNIKGHDRMYFSKQHKMFRIRYIQSRMDRIWMGTGRNLIRYGNYVCFSFVCFHMCGILGYATEKKLLSISEFPENAFIHHS